MTSRSKIKHRSNLETYGLARARDKAFDAVRRLWDLRQSEGLTQADLAARLEKDEGWVSKQLRSPGNWTLKTFGALVEGLKGEADIQALPLEYPITSRSNYDAYKVVDAQVSYASMEVSQGSGSEHIEVKRANPFLQEFSLSYEVQD